MNKSIITKQISKIGKVTKKKFKKQIYVQKNVTCNISSFIIAGSYCKPKKRNTNEKKGVFKRERIIYPGANYSCSTVEVKEKCEKRNENHYPDLVSFKRFC